MVSPLLAMQNLLTVLLLLGTSFIAHVTLWKLRVPRRPLKTLGAIFAATFCIWLVRALACAWPLLSIVRVTLLYVPVALSYLITYTAIEADSPTLSLMRFLAENRNGGRTVGEVEEFFSQRPFVKARLKVLENSGMVQNLNGTYVIVGKGPLAFQLILFYRKLYGPVFRGG